MVTCQDIAKLSHYPFKTYVACDRLYSECGRDSSWLQGLHTRACIQSCEATLEILIGRGVTCGPALGLSWFGCSTVQPH